MHNPELKFVQQYCWMKMKTDKMRVAAILAPVIACFTATVWFMDPFLRSVLVFGGIVWLAGPCLAIGVALLLAAAIAGRPCRGRLILVLSVVFVCALGVTASPIIGVLQARAVLAAKEYPAQVAPLLDAYRQAHGAYPMDLDKLPQKPRVPRLLRGPNRYRSDGQHYSFWFPKPGGLIDTWHYDSETHSWHLST